MTEKNININWGWKIVIAFIMFFILMGSLVYLSANEDHQLVSENYYAEEIAYQTIINQKINANKAGIYWLENSTGLCLIIPDSIIHLEGKIIIYRASDSSLDKVIEYNKQSVCLKTDDFKRGKWKISFVGKTEDNEFYTESIWIVG